MSITYKCGRRDTRLICKGVKAIYDGECVLTIEHGTYQTALTAYPGDTVTLYATQGQAVQCT